MITKPLDRVNEAYNGDLGQAFSEKTRSRVNWILNHVKGVRILDIGCSQGIIPIILGREGKVIDAIDIAEESIDYAKNALNNEHISVKNNVNFRVSNFMTESDLENEYETILLTEVLEHISDTEPFLYKIYNHLEKHGRLVVTVPFGINDYFDHKRTYYYLDLYDQLSIYFEIERIDYLGKWTGVVCKKRFEPSSDRRLTFQREDIALLEKGFYEVERDLLSKFNELNRVIRDKNDAIKNLNDKHEQLKTAIPEKEDTFNVIFQKLKHELDIKETQLLNKDTLLTSLQEEVNDLKKNLMKSLTSEKNAIQTLLSREDEINQIKKYNNDDEKVKERFEKENKKYKNEKEKYQKENENLKKKYNELQLKFNTELDRVKKRNVYLNNKYTSLKDSKLGSLTLRYWDWRKKLTKKNKG
ncbi:methyltransferase domain-containing protein [Fictibacillus sp. JL2B1089]|uniref:methyltransferase domain-containing protein n=1 Tax=Fictibacillus sp. JL2B1089 TaxID=3399565 RepID=UPI003A83C03A